MVIHIQTIVSDKLRKLLTYDISLDIAEVEMRRFLIATESN